MLSALPLSLTEHPEAVFAVVAQAAESFALILHACAGGQTVALASRKEISRRQAVDEAGQRRAFLNIVVRRTAEDVEVGPVQLREVVPIVVAAVSEQVVEPFVGKTCDLRQPPMRCLEQELSLTVVHEGYRLGLEALPASVLDVDAPHGDELPRVDVFPHVLGGCSHVAELVLLWLEAVRIGQAVSVHPIHVAHDRESG